VRVPLGVNGLFFPSVAMTVGAGSEKQGPWRLPVAAWPAPRYLAPGESVSMDVRIDRGPVRQMLCRRPLDEVELTVTAVLSPLTRGDITASAVPTVAVKPAVIIRRSLLARVAPERRKDTAAAYKEALGWIVYDMKHGQLPARMRAARQVASVLEWSRKVASRDAAPPQELVGKVSTPQAIRMLVEVLKDPSPAVRAEMLGAICDIGADEDTMRYVGAVVEDPSPLVRMRMAEMVGASATRGKETIITYLAQDSDKLVKLMASAFIESKEPK